jgi:hypothetical protein
MDKKISKNKKNKKEKKAGLHMMPNGKMMKDSDMKKTNKKK